MKPTTALAFVVSLVMAVPAGATIITVAEYRLGEPGSIVNNRPQDSSGNNRHFNAHSNLAIVNNTSPGAPGSTDYVTYEGANDGAWGADFSAIPTDNFAFEAWARVPTASLSQVAPVFTMGNSGPYVNVGINNGNWFATLNGAGWVGGNSGAGQPASGDTWTHLALVRSNGTSTFYINGVAQAGTLGNVPNHTGSAHIAVIPGGSQRYVGDLDEIRVFTFNPAQDDPVAAFNLIPEPSTMALLGLGLLAVFGRRR